MLKTIIIEDELSASKLLINILNEYCPRVEYVGQAANLKESIALICKTKPDVIFLDVALEDCTAFDVLEAIDHTLYKIIFMTAYEEYASAAFRFEAIDYILKPYIPKDVISALDRVKDRDYDERLLEQLAKIMPTTGVTKNQRISITTSKGILLLNENEILHIVADGAYCKINTTDGTSILSSKGLKEMETQLSSDNFFRTHLSHLVNINHIKEFQKEDGGRVVLSNKMSVPVSRRKRPRLLELLAIGFS